jgi:hypothetical protein
MNDRRDAHGCLDLFGSDATKDNAKATLVER